MQDLEQAKWQQRRDILICIIAVGIILWAVWSLVGQFFDAVFLLLIAMAIAFLITPAVNAMERRGMPRILAALICYVIVIAALVGFFYALIYSLVNQATKFTTTIVDFANNFPTNYTNFIQFLEKQVNIPRRNIDEAITGVQAQVAEFAQGAATSALDILLFVSGTFLNFLVILMLSFYLTLDGKRIRDSIFSVVPQRWMSHSLLFEDSLNRVVGNYMRGQLILATFIGIVVALICVANGLGEYALIFGVLGFLFETIPMVGPGLASISPVIASLLLPDPWPRTLIIIICFVAVQAFESNVLGPRIVGHAVGLHPVASILALIVFARLFGGMFGAFGGAMGALVATPIIAAAWVVIASIYRSIRGESSEQIISRKRAPWTIRRPTISSPLRFRSASGKLPPERTEETGTVLTREEPVPPDEPVSPSLHPDAQPVKGNGDHQTRPPQSQGKG